MKRILLIRGGGLGDFIVITPVLAALRRRWPEADLALAARPGHALLAKTCGLADTIISLESARMSCFFQYAPEFSKEELDFFGSIDLAVSFMPDDDGLLQKNMQNAGVGKWLAVSSKVEQGHATEHFFMPLVRAGIIPAKSADAMPRLKLGSAAISKAALQMQSLSGLHKRCVFLHPGSGSPAKNWPLEHFVAVSELIRIEFVLQPVFVTGEADADLARHLKGTLKNILLLENPDIVDLAGMLSTASAYIGNDSGVSHLAAALGIPVVAIFGPSDPACWAPRGPFVRIVQGKPRSSDGLKRLQPEKIMEAFRLCTAATAL